MAAQDFIQKHAPVTKRYLDQAFGLEHFLPITQHPNLDTRGMYYGDEFSPEIDTFDESIGTIGNLRHAATTAQLKNKIAQAITPGKDIGIKPGIVANTIGGIGANLMGLGHEVKGLSKDWSLVKDPNWWRATGEDIIANLYGTVKGTTDVSHKQYDIDRNIPDQKIYDSMLSDFIYDKGIMSNLLDWGTMTGEGETQITGPFDMRVKHPGMGLKKFRDIYHARQNRQKNLFNQKVQAAEKRAAHQRAYQPTGGGGGWSPSGADLSPGGGYGQSPTGSDIAGTPFSRGGILGAF